MSIDLYSKAPDHYDQLQRKRHDYVGAEKAFVDLAVKYLNGKKDLSVADFCCGVGKDSRLLAEHILVDRAILIDINSEFLRLALEQRIKAKTIQTIESDILS